MFLKEGDCIMKKNVLALFLIFFLTFTTALFIIASETPCYEYLSYTDNVAAIAGDIKIQLEYFDNYVTCNDEVDKSDTEILLEYLSSIPFNLSCTEISCLFDNGRLTATISMMISIGLQGSSFYVANFGYIYPPSNFIDYIESHGFPVPQIYGNNILIWTASKHTCYFTPINCIFNTSE